MGPPLPISFDVRYLSTAVNHSFHAASYSVLLTRALLFIVTSHPGKPPALTSAFIYLLALTYKLLHIAVNTSEAYIGPSTRNNIDSSLFGRVKKLLNISNALKVIDTLFRRMISPIKV
jgi:hypothetical protein